VIFRSATILLWALLLTGCASWSGPPFYASNGANNWLPTGTYHSVSDGKSRYFRWDGKQITDLPSGKKEKEDGPAPVLVPLSGTKLDAYIGQLSLEGTDGKTLAFYALFARNGSVWTYVFPDCFTTKAILLDAGGVMDGAPAGMHRETPTEDLGSLFPVRGLRHHRRSRQAPPTKIAQVTADPPENEPTVSTKDDGLDEYGGHACHFPMRASLEKAARRYFAERQIIGDKFVRIGD
jgi:hypothetical protein